MSNLKSKGDLTIKLLNLDLFYKGGTPFLCYKSIQIQNAIFQLIFEILIRWYLGELHVSEYVAVNFWFTFVLSSLAYITIPRNNGQIKINWNKN